MVKKILKYSGIGIILMFSLVFITFYFLLVKSYQIVITKNGETEEYYSYRRVIDIEQQGEYKIINIYLNHQKFWNFQHWINFPLSREFSLIVLKIKNDKLEEAYSKIIDRGRKDLNKPSKKIPLEGTLIIDDNILRNLNFVSENLQSDIQVGYFIRRLDLKDSDISLEH